MIERGLIWDFENWEACKKAWEELDKEGLIDFDLQLGLDNMGLVEAQEECEQCQVIVETWDSNIPMGVYDRMKAKALGAVYHGC